MAIWETIVSGIATVGGFAGLAAFYQAHLTHKSNQTRAKLDEKKGNDDTALRQQQELNADEAKFRADILAVWSSQNARIETLTKTQDEAAKAYQSLDRDYATLLARVERQADRIQDITAIQAQAQYWEAQAEKTQKELKTREAELKAALIHLESAQREADQWREQFHEMQRQFDQLSEEVSHLRLQLKQQEAEIERLQQQQHPLGGSS